MLHSSPPCRLAATSRAHRLARIPQLHLTCRRPRSVHPRARSLHVAQAADAHANVLRSGQHAEPDTPADHLSSNGSAVPAQQHDKSAVGDTWAIASSDEDWSPGKPFSWRDIDWGFAALLGIILGLSLGAFRLLSHFHVYASHSRPTTATVMLDTRRCSKQSTAKAATRASTADKQSKDAAAATAAALPASATAAAAEPAAAEASSATEQREAAASSCKDSTRSASASSSSAPQQQPTTPPAPGAIGGPQPSPLDQPLPSTLQQQQQWQPGDGAGAAAASAASLGLPALDLLPDFPGALPPIPHMQVEAPSKAASQAELADLPEDYSVPSLRERAHLAMRASAAAMESSQRAAAYSAAASSAASRAAEAAEQAAAAAANVQSALEHAAEGAMAAAMERMNRAVEMVADAESRAAAAAAMATAHQDMSESQAALAVAAADLPAEPSSSPSGVQGHVADIHRVLHAKLFNAGSLLREWGAALVTALLGVVAAVQGAFLSAGAAVKQTVRGALGVFGAF